MPILTQTESEDFLLRFDYLGESRHDLVYSIQSCTYDWQINDVSEHFYLEGFNKVPFYEYRMSRTTMTDYTHFYAQVPDENIKLLQSGNFLLTVYLNDDQENPLFTRRFCINEKRVSIEASVKKIYDHQHELQVKVNLENLRVSNPLTEIKVVIIKNYNWNDKVEIKTPPVLRNNTIYVDLPFQLIKDAGAEFFNFEIRSIKYMSERIENIDFQVPYYHIYLKPDEITVTEPYFSKSDLNGRYSIDLTDATDSHSEADYIYVHFKLKSPQLLPGDVYIYGAITNWETEESSAMQYNFNTGYYQKTLRLKQGFYDYTYVTKEAASGEIKYDLTVGNRAETENDYLIFVYYHEIMSDFDRLVGYALLNSEGN